MKKVLLAGLLCVAWAANANAIVDISSKVQIIRGTLNYNYVTGQNFLNVSIKNISSEDIPAPVQITLDIMTPSTVSWVNPDGVRSDGRQFFNIGKSPNLVLKPGEVSDVKLMCFRNPNRLRFTFNLKAYVPFNASGLIGVQGGSVKDVTQNNSTSGISIVFPPNSLPKDTVVSINKVPYLKQLPLLPNNAEAASEVISVIPSMTLNVPATVCFPVEDIYGNQYGVYYLDEINNAWIKYNGLVTIDSQNKRICETVNHFTIMDLVKSVAVNNNSPRMVVPSVNPTDLEKLKMKLYLVYRMQFLKGVDLDYARINGILTEKYMIDAAVDLASAYDSIGGLGSLSPADLFVAAEPEVLDWFTRVMGSSEVANEVMTLVNNWLTCPLAKDQCAFSLYLKSFQAYYTFIYAHNIEDVNKSMREILIADEVLYEYYHYGTRLDLLKGSLGIGNANNNFDDVIIAIAEKIKNEDNWFYIKWLNVQGIDYYDINIIRDDILKTISAITRLATKISPPLVQTTPPSYTGTHSVTLNGKVNPNGVSTEAWFEWGQDQTLATSTETAPHKFFGPVTSSQPVDFQLTNLDPHTTYYYRVVASNGSGTPQKGTIQSFGPPLATPIVFTGSFSFVTGNGATLSGSVNPNGLDTEAWFEYGTDPSLSNPLSTPHQNKGSGITYQPVEIPINGLSSGTTYYYRIAASNLDGPQRGDIGNFATLPPPQPVVPVFQQIASNVPPWVKLGEDGFLYFSDGRTLYKYTNGGSKLWEWTIPTIYWSQINDFAISGNGVVYVSYYEQPGSRNVYIEAVDTTTGLKLWPSRVLVGADRNKSGPICIISNGIILIRSWADFPYSTTPSKLSAINVDGSVRWEIYQIYPGWSGMAPIILNSDRTTFYTVAGYNTFTSIFVPYIIEISINNAEIIRSKELQSGEGIIYGLSQWHTILGREYYGGIAEYDLNFNRIGSIPLRTPLGYGFVLGAANDGIIMYKPSWNIFAVDRYGNDLWSLSSSTKDEYLSESNILYAILGGANNTSNELAAISPVDGNIIWKQVFQNSITSYAIGSSGDIYVISNARLYKGQ